MPEPRTPTRAVLEFDSVMILGCHKDWSVCAATRSRLHVTQQEVMGYYADIEHGQPLAIVVQWMEYDGWTF